MRTAHEIEPQTGKRKRPRAGETLSVDEIRRRIRDGEVKRDDLSLREREIYAEDLKKARRY